MTSQELNSIFDRLVSDWNGKALLVLPSTIADNTNVPENQKRGQCFDVSAKFTDMLGIPHYPGNPTPFPYQNASEIYTRPNSVSSQYFSFIPNTPEFVPQKGDICVFSGIPGHVSVATGKGDLNTFESFDQNFPTGSVCKLVTHNYSNLLGVLRLKVTQDNMGDNIKRKSYFTDIMVQGVTEFWGGNVNTDNITEAKWREYIAWIKDNVYRAGQYDLTKKEAGVTGNVPYGPVVAALRKQGSFNIEDFKKKVISFVQSL